MDYLDRLIASPLPVPVWGLATLWLVVHVMSSLLYLRSLRLTRRQSFVIFTATEAPPPVICSLVLPLAFAAYVFGCSLWFGNRFASFLGGGWFILSCFGLASNLRNVVVWRGRAQFGGLRGQLHMNRDALLRERAAESGAAALFCLTVLLLVPHLALVGAAFLLGASAAGFSLKAQASASAAQPEDDGFRSNVPPTQ